jgi:predicted ArsR family transcriptional regulator
VRIPTRSSLRACRVRLEDLEEANLASRSQITRLTARIEALATAAEGRPAYVWRNSGESEEEAFARHYGEHPEDRKARQTFIFQWLDRNGP